MPNWNERLVNFAQGAARASQSMHGGSSDNTHESFGGIYDYDVQHRYRFGAGGPQVGGTAPLGEELGYIAHKKIFQSGINMAKPSVSKSGYYDQALDYRKAQLAGLNPLNWQGTQAIYPRRVTSVGQAGPEGFAEGGDPSGEGENTNPPAPPYVFTRPRSSGNLGSGQEGAIDTTGREVTSGQPALGAGPPGLPNWTGSGTVKGTLGGGASSL